MFKSAYDHRRGLHKRVTKSFLDDNGDPAKGRTQQHLKDAVDVHNILAKYARTGLIDHVNRAVGDYGDFTQVNEYQDNLNMVLRAQQSFDALPATVRKRFGNDPGAFFEFATNPQNHDELVKLKLARERPTSPAPAPAPAPAPIT